MASNPLAEIRSIRLGKAQTLREMGLNPYPAKSGRTHYAGPILAKFEEHDGKEATLAGRLMSWRKQGGLAFGHIQDETGRIQLFLKKQNVQASSKEHGNIGFTEFNLIDLGDIVEASGKVMRTERGEISLMVRDNGPGIAPEDFERLFDGFFTTKEDGMGIGLAVCHSIVLAHGGKISVDNHPQGGAIFRFSLDRAPPGD